ncbi:hypothetical protein DOTSEDRAFT_71590 [Dothistroma septosporum NZE10]|uniref:GTP:AMP phosphotransferase, mitochondrial n=1 Tax=Dothistroma septosporum (strain NZE10 / CBS 128990) TaxID=675120 RepID=N1PN04_DOTSN|nr:hypothetical protein DOTSEDRAFT_71590 [Dothistroma septosporum NZE10]
MTTSRLRRAARLILIGAPGVGKGTQTDRLLKQFPQLSAISSGDLLRENVRNKTPLGIQAEQLMKTGALVPDSMMLRLIRNALTTKGWLTPESGLKPFTVNFDATAASEISQPDSFMNLPHQEDFDTEYRYSEDPDASFILDGFPRNAAQAAQLEKMIPVNMAIHVHTPADIIAERMGNRWVHAASGRVYNTTFNAPKVAGKDDVTGEALIQRDDDKPEVWKARLKTFEESSKSLLDHYERRGVLWKVSGDSSDEITPRLFEEFGRRFGA